MPEAEAVWLRVRRRNVGWAVLSFMAEDKGRRPRRAGIWTSGEVWRLCQSAKSRKSEVVRVGPLKGLS